MATNEETRTFGAQRGLLWGYRRRARLQERVSRLIESAEIQVLRGLGILRAHAAAFVTAVRANPLKWMSLVTIGAVGVVASWMLIHAAEVFSLKLADAIIGAINSLLTPLEWPTL